jgi:D-serine dehydratase
VELAIHTMFDSVATLTRQGVAEGWFAPGELILTAGGSSFFDLAAAALAAVQPGIATRVVLRSGCYLSHDALHYERMQQRLRQRSPALWGSGPGLRSAIEVWALVQSVPEPTRAVCGLGRRDVSFDMDLPVALAMLRPGRDATPQPLPAALRTTTLFDQHAYLDLEPGGAAMPLRVGDLVGFGISHPCTTFDKWPLLHVVDDDYRITGGVRTFF